MANVSRAGTTSTPTKAVEPIPPLENGDRLSRDEFERRFDAMPHVKKAELIEGVVYMGSPVGHESHGRPHFRVIGWLSEYTAATPGVDGGDNSSCRLDLDNLSQPDAFLYVDPAIGGQVRISDDDYIVGAPELIVEVASSSVSYDLHAKFNVYRRNLVREHIVWRVRDQEIDWFALREGVYARLEPDAGGILRGEVFPGLWLDPAALIRGDRSALSRVLQAGISSAEHTSFVAELRKRAASS